jgi:hypothetical protein
MRRQPAETPPPGGGTSPGQVAVAAPTEPVEQPPGAVPTAAAQQPTAQVPVAVQPTPVISTVRPTATPRPAYVPPPTRRPQVPTTRPVATRPAERQPTPAFVWPTSPPSAPTRQVPVVAPTSTPVPPPTPQPTPTPPIWKTFECRLGAEFDVEPDEAMLAINGKELGIVDEYDGFGDPGEYTFPGPGTYYASFSHEGYQTIWVKIVAKDDAKKKFCDIEKDLKKDKKKKKDDDDEEDEDD